MPGFLIIGETIACFIDDGNVAEPSDALISFSSMDVIVVPAAFTSHVGLLLRIALLSGIEQNDDDGRQIRYL